MKDFVKSHKKLVIALAVAAVALAGAGIGLAALSSRESEPINQTYTAQYGAIDSTVTGKGYVEAGREIKITAPVGVTVKEVLVKAGDSVGAGQALANIEPASITTVLAQATSNLNELQNSLDNGNLSSIQRDALIAQRDAVQSYVNQLYDLRAYPVITAPQVGIINNVYLNDGSPVEVQNTRPQQSSGNSDNTNVSLFTVNSPELVSQRNINLNFKPIIQFGYFLNSQVPLPFNLFNSDLKDHNKETEKVNLIESNSSDSSNFIKVSDGSTTETYEEVIEYGSDDTYVNGRTEIIENHNIEEIIEEGGSTSTLTPSSPSNQSESAQNSSNNNIQSVASYTTYDAIAFKMGSMDELIVNVQIDERDILDITQGQKATVTLEALPDEKFEGTIRNIASTAQTSEGNTKYSVEVVLNTDKNLKSAMTANVTISTGSNQNALLIPVDALQDNGDKKFVYTSESDDGTLGGEVDVTTGLSNKDYVEITGGIQNGTKVYYKPADNSTTITEQVTNEGNSEEDS